MKDNPDHDPNILDAWDFTEKSAHMVLIKLKKIRIRSESLKIVFMEGLISKF